MLLSELVPQAKLFSKADVTPDGEVTGFAIDSRNVEKGHVFGAFQGALVNGEDYIPAAEAAGAIAVVARPEAKVARALHIADAEPRRRFAHLAARFFGPMPTTIAAVTGTNGKTSVAEMTRQLWQAGGDTSASIGTLGVTTSNGRADFGLTTPDIVTFLTTMADLARTGVTHAVFEASSHGLSQYRSEGVPVTAAAFTNLSRDHLDYHGDMESYFAAKRRLFEEVLAPGGTAVIWADDDPWSGRIIATARARGLDIVTVGRQGETLRLIEQVPTRTGQRLTVARDDHETILELPLIGAYQAANALCAAGLVLATGGNWDRIVTGLAQLEPVPGRLELAASTAEGAAVFVDYAHTPDGLRAALSALRPHCRGRLICLFGAGGDRDAGKRPEMGQVAANLADHVIVTDDNPRTEDPAAIRAAILRGAPQAMEIGDRREAIAAALAEAKSGDIVLLAGKGHEQGQIIGESVIPFDDAAIAREVAA